MIALNSIKAVVTGGVSGLGYAVVEKIVQSGGQVAIIDINKDKGHKTQQSLGQQALFIATDVSNESAVDTAVAAAVKQFGFINLVVNCAGIATSQRVLGREALMPTKAFADLIAINLTSTFCVCRAAANVMQHNSIENSADQARGVIINTASIAAYEGQIGQAAYAASKGGIISLTLPLAREFSRIGVRVVTIAPGLFATPMFEQLSEKAINQLTANIPFPQRAGHPSEFADLVMHIYQNPAINGETIRLDSALRM